MAAGSMKKSSVEECLSHTGEEIKAICNTCDKPACIQCLLGEHNGHKVTEIKRALQERSKNLEKLQKELEETQQYFEYKMNEIPFREEENNAEINSIVEVIEHNGQMLKDKIDKITQRYIANAENCRSNNQTKIDEIKTLLDQYSSKNVKFINFYEGKAKSKSIRNTISMERSLRKHLDTAFELERLSFPELEIPQFTPGRYTIEEVTDIYGRFTLGDKVEEAEDSEAEEHVYDYISVETHGSDDDILEPKTFSATNTPVVSICPLTITQAWIRDETGKVLKMVNENGHVIRSLHEVSKKSDMAITPEGAVLVSCPEKYCIKKYVQDGSVRIFIRTGGLQPHCLCVQYSTGNIWVGLVDKWIPNTDASSERLIQRYSSAGHPLEQIVHSKTSLGIFSRGPRHFVLPFKVRVNEQNGDLAVVNWTNVKQGQIILLSKSGQVKFKYPNESQDSFFPNDVLFMGDASLLVCDEVTQSLILLNYEGVYQKVLEKFRHIPHSLANFGKGKIWIGMNDGTVEVLQIKENIP